MLTEFEVHFIKYFYRALNADELNSFSLKYEDWNRDFYNYNFLIGLNLEKNVSKNTSVGGSSRLLLKDYKNIY